MSDTQLPTDETFGASTPAPSVEDAIPSQIADVSPSTDEVEIGGRMVSSEEATQTWGDMPPVLQKAYTQKSQGLADDRRAFEQERVDWEANRESVNGRSSQPDNGEQDIADRLLEGQRRMELRMDAQDKRYEDSMADVRREDDMAAAISMHRNKPLFDEQAIRTYMAQNNLAPEHAGIAYTALTAHRAGLSIGEQRGAARTQLPVMGSTGPTGVSPEFTSAREVLPAKPIGNTSWQDLDAAAAADDNVR